MCGRFICDQYVYLYSLVLPTCLLRDVAKYWVCLNDVKQFHVTTHDTKEVCCAVYVRMIVIDIFCCLLLSRLNFASLLSQISLRDSSRIVLKRILVARLNIHHNSFELCLTYIACLRDCTAAYSIHIHIALEKRASVQNLRFFLHTLYSVSTSPFSISFKPFRFPFNFIRFDCGMPNALVKIGLIKIGLKVLHCYKKLFQLLSSVSLSIFFL